MAYLTRTKDVEQAEDYGFFGPDSVTWKVWSYPTSLTIGFQRAVVVEELDPALIAAVDKTHEIYRRPRTRYDRTLRYFAMCAFGDSRSTAKAADILVKVHSKAIGTDELTGKRYDANDPESQLWIHMTAWHSILKAYEVYGPGKLSAEEEAQYWEECAIGAQLQTVDPARVPRSREGVQAYFEEMRPRLAGSEIAQEAMAQLLDARVMLPEVPLVLRPASAIVSSVLRAGTIATMPHWMRRMGGLHQSRLTDLAVVPPLRVSFALIHLNPYVMLAVLNLLSPMTVPVVAPVLLGVEPEHDETMTPYEAQARYGYDRPADAHQALRDKQHRRVFGQGVEPSDEGIIESQAILGSIA